MADADLNLLTALDALLTEGSVAGAARRLGLSGSAMSRTLARLRAATGDPLLVRAGRGLVPTPHAAALAARAGDLAREAHSVLSPASGVLDLTALERTFTLRANEGFVDAFGGALLAAILRQAPGVCLRFAPKPDKDFHPLREGAIDLEIGVLGESGPEIRLQALFEDRFVGIVRRGHALTSSPMTPERYAGCDHVVTSRRGRLRGPVDDALTALGLTRRVVAMVPGFPAALAMVATSDLVGLVTQSFVSAQKDALVAVFDLPVATASITISQMWHPRMDADPAHRWLRGVLLSVCRPGLSQPALKRDSH
ncbi:LysR family transcriptional regulator [Acidisoma silvae]|uniref:LysR family transcriptional regulator n=1 Tax=Acidisoma silvae TaxID=2802396 RepID=A0A964DXG1_9PROT|nr:LysR family transcriptional regulator [Acidisoma silvae]MCB8874171.1 LysR family transcriptional regulator [Acidisoma silvae]